MVFETQYLLRDLESVARENPQKQDGELVYQSCDTRVYATNDPEQLARALCAPYPYRWSAYTEVKSSNVRIWHHYHWAPLRFEAEIWVYPRPQVVEVQTTWEPEWTYICDLQIKAATTVTVVAVLNGVLHEIAHVIPVPTRRGWRRMAK